MELVLKKIANFTVTSLTISFLSLLVVPANANQVMKSKESSLVSNNKLSIFGLPPFILDGNLLIGLGGGYSTKPYKGIDNSVSLIHRIAYQSGSFFFDSNLVGYTIFSHQNIAVTLIGSLHFPEFDLEDSKYLGGMKEAEIAFETGFAVTWETSG